MRSVFVKGLFVAGLILVLAGGKQATAQPSYSLYVSGGLEVSLQNPDFVEWPGDADDYFRWPGWSFGIALDRALNDPEWGSFGIAYRYSRFEFDNNNFSFDIARTLNLCEVGCTIEKPARLTSYQNHVIQLRFDANPGAENTWSPYVTVMPMFFTRYFSVEQDLTVRLGLEREMQTVEKYLPLVERGTVFGMGLAADIGGQLKIGDRTDLRAGIVPRLQLTQGNRLREGMLRFTAFKFGVMHDLN